MLMRIFLGVIMIGVFLVVFPFINNLFMDNQSGFMYMIQQTNVSQMELAFWNFFPLAFLILGIGGVAYLIVRDRER